jgi:hypothetical protein
MKNSRAAASAAEGLLYLMMLTGLFGKSFATPYHAHLVFLF